MSVGVLPAEAAGMVRLEAAREAILDAIGGAVATESIRVEEALGRVLAEPVIAAVTLPPWDNSAMDGYAIRAADVAAATASAPVRLSVVGEVRAGSAPDEAVGHGSAIRIATGAPLPPGADAVVPVELTTPVDLDGTPGPRGRDASGPVPAACLVHGAVAAGSHVRRAGSDLRAGERLLGVGDAISAASVALAAGAGVPTLVVHRRPRVAVLATGDEVRSAGSELGLGGIPDANGPGLRALVSAAGGQPVDLGIAPDAFDQTVARLRQALGDGGAGVDEADRLDAVVVSGGVSVGPYDVVKRAFDAVGRVDLWRVAVQPGKPFAFGTARSAAREAPVLLFGLPGNPVSSFVTFELFVRPAIRKLAGRRDLLRPIDHGVLLDEARTSEGRRAFLRVTTERDADGAARRDERGRARVRLSRGPAGQGSHVLSALASADALAVVPESVAVHPAGDPVELWWLDQA